MRKKLCLSENTSSQRRKKNTNRKCLFASIFLNVNCERGQVKRDSPQLSESHPQSYCSLEKNDAKHSLKPIYTCLYNPRRIKLANPECWLHSCRYCVRMCVVFCRVTKGIVVQSCFIQFENVTDFTSSHDYISLFPTKGCVQTFLMRVAQIRCFLLKKCNLHAHTPTNYSLFHIHLI